MKKYLVAFLLIMAMLGVSSCVSVKPDQEQSKAESSETPAESGPAESSEESKPFESVQETSESEEPTFEITGGSSQSEAEILQTNVRYTGKYREGEVWVAFKTGSKEEVDYSVTLENLTPGSKYLEANLYDENGTIQKPDSLNYNREHNNNTIAEAKESGRASTGWIKTLKPNTTYYLQLKGGSKAEYSLRITDPNLGYIPKNEDRMTVTDANQLDVASDQDRAPFLDLNTRYQGKYVEGYTWVAFTTGDGEDVNYSVTVENLTPGSKYLEANLFDEYGTIQKPDSLNYTREHNTNTIAEAKESGRAATGWIKTLKPNTTYYLQIKGGSKAEYSLRITDPNLGYIPKNEDRMTVTDANSLDVASDQDHAPILDLNTRYQGKYVEGYTWVAFTTGDGEDVNYSVTVENLTPGSKYLEANLFDEYGTIQKPDSLNYTREHN
ncbi:MAG: hypothetical protein IJM90_00650, partial [Firmicutes bacterium]|nr:hypothetical protein [Bacillota bacterium]